MFAMLFAITSTLVSWALMPVAAMDRALIDSKLLQIAIRLISW